MKSLLVKRTAAAGSKTIWDKLTDGWQGCVLSFHCRTPSTSYDITDTDGCSTRLQTWWVLSHFTMNNKINDFMKTLAMN